LSFFEPGKGQLFWLWLKKAQKGSKKLKIVLKNSKKLKKFELTNPCLEMVILRS
jgi:hypothetical protein|tara:strand:- start:317 stop:478 length:162 start_codon:yes stop_codon:yes gene_type:complete